MRSSAPSSRRCSSTRRALAWCASSAAAVALLTGCGPKYVAAPDSPMLVLQAKGRLRVAMQDGDRMVDVGWIDAADIEGQTVVQFDWTEP